MFRAFRAFFLSAQAEPLLPLPVAVRLEKFASPLRCSEYSFAIPASRHIHIQVLIFSSHRVVHVRKTSILASHSTHGDAHRHRHAHANRHQYPRHRHGGVARPQLCRCRTVGTWIFDAAFVAFWWIFEFDQHRHAGHCCPPPGGRRVPPGGCRLDQCRHHRHSLIPRRRPTSLCQVSSGCSSTTMPSFLLASHTRVFDCLAF